MDRGAWWAAVHGVAKSRTRLSDFTFTFHFHALEKEIATHSSVLAWRIPGTGEPGGLPSMGLHRVRHNWSDLVAAAACLRHCVRHWTCSREGLPWWLSGKESACNAGDVGSITGLESSPKGGHDRNIPVFLPGVISWTEESGGLESVGLQRVAQNWNGWACKRASGSKMGTVPIFT